MKRKRVAWFPVAVRMNATLVEASNKTNFKQIYMDTKYK